MEATPRIKLTLVCGAWSSGSTAVAGILAHLGLNGFGPFAVTLDERTPNSYEMLPFRDMLLELASENPIGLRASSPEPIRAALERFRRRILDQEFGPYDPATGPPIFMKHALAALLIPEIAACFDTRLIVVTRPLRAIEATRQRRGWDPQYGAAGAKVIYSHIFTTLMNEGIPAHLVHYPSLLADPYPQILTMARFCEVEPGAQAFQDATRFISGSASAQVVGYQPSASKQSET